MQQLAVLGAIGGTQVALREHFLELFSCSFELEH